MTNTIKITAEMAAKAGYPDIWTIDGKDFAYESHHDDYLPNGTCCFSAVEIGAEIDAELYDNYGARAVEADCTIIVPRIMHGDDWDEIDYREWDECYNMAEAYVTRDYKIIAGSHISPLSLGEEG